MQSCASISPTNLGLLLNARQAACEFGYLTVPEFVELTQKTLDTLAQLPKYRGHLMNWYDTRTLEAKAPFFISSVDSGNLVASLWTLRRDALNSCNGRYFPRRLSRDFLTICACSRDWERWALGRYVGLRQRFAPGTG